MTFQAQMHPCNMPLQVAVAAEGFAAQLAGKLFTAPMRHIHVFLQVTAIPEGFFTIFTRVFLHTFMNVHDMSLQAPLCFQWP